MTALHDGSFDIYKVNVVSFEKNIADLQISKVQQVQQKIWRGSIIG